MSSSLTPGSASRENQRDQPDDSLLARFQDPPAKFRGAPFWSWNGKLEKEELLRQIDAIARMGMGGFFMHSRTGLETEYLGEEWFDLINTCAEAGQRRGLSAWIYDEDRWPSGSAGGLATREELYRMKYMRLTTFSPGEAIPWPEKECFLAAFLGRLEDLNWRAGERIGYRSIEASPAEMTVLLFTWEHMSCHSFYNGNSYLDTLNLEATNRFLEVTHEAYARHCGKKFGSGIEGIFTDEPHRGMIMCRTNAQGGPPDSGWVAPFTGDLREQFQERFGYDLYDHLPGLFLQPDGRRLVPVKWQYVELLQQLFLERWAIPSQEWCREHNLKLTGHVLHEDSLGAQVIPCGSVLRYYEHMDIPGIDVLGRVNRSFWVAKQVVSVARQMGKPLVLSELYGCTGWQMDFAGHKAIGDWQAIQGVNFRCHHLSWYTMAGEAKRDYPASIFFQSAWYPQYGYVEEYFARLGLILAEGEPVCEVLVVNPVESLWAQIHGGWADWLGAVTEPVLELEKRYAELYHWLTGAQIDFDYGDEDHLARFGAVQAGEGTEGPKLRLGHGRYRAVVVAGMETMRAATLQLLEDFREAGGQVIFAGPAPEHLDAELSARPAEFAAEAVSLEWDRQALLDRLRRTGCAAVELNYSAPAELEEWETILAHVRRSLDRTIVALVNTSENHRLGEVAVAVAGEGSVEEWNCRDGSRRPIDSVCANGRVTWTTSLARAGERVFVIGPAPGAAPAPAARKAPDAVHAYAGDFPVTLGEPNACVLDYPEWQWEDEEWQSAVEILKLEEILRARFKFAARAGDMLQPWCRDKAPPKELGKLRLRYRFRVEAELPPLDLALEKPEAWRISLDGKPLAVAGTGRWFVDPCLRVTPLSGETIPEGEHVLELITTFTAETDLEAVFLLGQFGVAAGSGKKPPVLTFLPASLSAGDVTARGLPFYSGPLTYELPPPVEFQQEAQRVRLRFPAFGGACVQVRQGAEDPGHIVGFPPYDIELDPRRLDQPIFCDVVLTRRNTFGPLHEVPIHQPFIGPGSFRTRGEEFSDEYQLFPAGLLEPPVLEFWR